MIQLGRWGFLLLFVAGIIGVVYGLWLVADTESRTIFYAKQYQISYYQQPQNIPYDFPASELRPEKGTQTNIKRFYISFTSMDVYAVGNPLYLSMNLIVNNPEKVKAVKLLLVPITDDYSDLNASYVPTFLDIREKRGVVIDLPQNGTNTFGTDESRVFKAPMDVSILMFIQTTNGAYEKFRGSQTLISVLPYIYLLQALSEENAQIQILQTNNTNDIVQGLTWLIVGALPLGSALQIRHSNQEKAEKHRRDLHEGFLQYYNTRIPTTFRLLPILEQFPDSSLYLQHIFTSHPELDTAIRNLIVIERQMGPVGTVIPRPLSIQHTNAFADFRQQLVATQNHMRQHVEDIGGICENCIKFHDIKGIKFKKMKSRLDSFTMPF